jgi:cytoskeletal protein CcmA (bactofilin family)
MAFFNNDAEPNSQREHSYEQSPAPIPLANPSLAGENVGPGPHAPLTLRKGGGAVGKPAYLDSRTKINGKLSFEGPAQIDGQVEGEIVAGEHLVIGEGAHVTAKIKASSVVVAGMVSGEIVATERIEICASAKISGNLTAPRMVMHEGAMFEGHCAMKPEELGEERKPLVRRRQEQVEARPVAQS